MGPFPFNRKFRPVAKVGQLDKCKVRKTNVQYPYLIFVNLGTAPHYLARKKNAKSAKIGQTLCSLSQKVRQPEQKRNISNIRLTPWSSLDQQTSAVLWGGLLCLCTTPATVSVKFAGRVCRSDGTRQEDDRSIEWVQTCTPCNPGSATLEEVFTVCYAFE